MKTIQSDATGGVPIPCFPALDDASLGKFFAEEAERELAYCPGLGWLAWEGAGWATTAGDIAADACLQRKLAAWDTALRDAIRASESPYIRDILKDTADRLFKWRATPRRQNLLTAAKPHMLLPVDQLDAREEALACLNGVIDLKTGALLEHDPAMRLSRYANAVYIPGAVYTRWELFLMEIMENKIELCRFLQKAVGYALAGNPVEDCLFLLYGASTRNGKSTFLSSIMRMLGSYAASARPESFAIQRFASGANASEDIARLRGARLVAVSELPPELELNAALVKAMTGRDRMTARFLRKDSFEFTPQCVLFMNTNHLPRVSDPTLFRSGRVITIPFNVHFSEKEQDRGLAYEFASLEAQAAILAWAVEGYRMYRAEGLRSSIPVEVREATTEYAAGADVLGQFLSDCVEERLGFEEKSSLVYEAYTRWAEANGHGRMSQTRFTQELVARGFQKEKKHAARYWKDIYLQRLA